MNLHKKQSIENNDHLLDGIKSFRELAKETLPELYQQMIMQKELEQDNEQNKIKAQLEIFKSEGVA